MLPLASAKLDGNETEFKWPEKKKELKEIIVNNTISMSTISLQSHTIEGRQAICNIKLNFADDRKVEFDAIDPNNRPKKTQKKSLQVPQSKLGIKSMTVVVV